MLVELSPERACSSVREPKSHGLRRAGRSDSESDIGIDSPAGRVPDIPMTHHRNHDSQTTTAVCPMDFDAEMNMVVVSPQVEYDRLTDFIVSADG